MMGGFNNHGAGERPPHRRILMIMCGAALPALAATASAQSAPAPPDVVSIVLTPQLVGSTLQSLQLESRFTGDQDGETKLIFPEGAESISEMEVHNATLSGEGEERRLRHAAGAAITIRYKITQKANGPFENRVQPTYFSVLGPAIFIRLDEREPEYRFRWGQLPTGWTVASDLDHAKGDPVAPNLISTLYGGSDVIVKEYRVGQGRLRLAMRNDSALTPDFLGPLLGRIGEVANELWQDTGTDYLVTLTTLPDYGGQAGMGLGDAFALYLPAKPDLLELRNTLAHEYLHTWIGRRFGSGPRWFSEGFTQYYSPLLNLRAGSYSLSDFATQWNAMLRSYANSPLRLTPAAQVEEVWRGNRDAEQISENRSGMVAALMDLELQRKTKGRLRLADIMVQVRKDADAKRGSGDGPTRIVRRAREMAGLDLQPLIDRHLVRGEEVMLPADVFGRCLNVTTSSVPKYDRGFDVQGFGEPVTKIDPSSPAYAAGIREGMIVVAREGGRAGDSSVENVYRVRDAAGERVIRYLPMGKERIRIQQVQVKPGLDARAERRCIREVSGLRG